MSVVEREVATPVVTEADVLNRAADLLEEFDWRQGTAGSREEGSMCAVGAIYEASYDLEGARFSDVSRLACMINGVPKDFEAWPLAIWNDTPGRTKAEVVARLREAAKAAA